MNKKLMEMYAAKYYTKAYSLFHKIEKKVLFESFMGKQYSDNPRAISEKLHEMYPEYEIVWTMNAKNDALPDYVRTVSKTSRDYYKELATSFAFVNNEGMSPNLNKRRKQFFIQTWHGDRGFKKVLYDAHEDSKREIPVMDGKITDLCVAGSQYGEDKYRSAFHYYGRVLKVGTPRNDGLINPSSDKQHEIRTKLGLDDDTKIILYAPTFRGYQTKSVIQVDFKRVIDILERDGSKWVVLIRAHASTVGGFANADDFMQDVSRYPDIADLMMVADMLMTDFSSCSGDFIVRRKPVILVPFDKEVYMKNCRTFKAPLEDTGYLVAENQEQLEDILTHTTLEQFAANSEKVLDFYGTVETGKASEAVCEEINKFYKEHF